VTGHREVGDADPLASTGIPTVLALEVTYAGPACDYTGRAAADRDNAAANRTCGEERIANELLLKLGIRLSPRTVRRYMPPRPRPSGSNVDPERSRSRIPT
jgi:hypothetical protein